MARAAGLALAGLVAAGCARDARPRDVSAPGHGMVPGSVALGTTGGVLARRGPLPGAAEDPADHDELPPLPNPDAPPPSAPSAAAAALPTASRYASMDRATCEGELARRNAPFERVASETRGVIAPVRVTGALSGVEFHSMLPAAQRRTSPYEIYDCRLVLALDDYAKILARHDVVEVIHYSVYRPPTAKAVPSGPGRRHSGALAIDLATFKTKDGRVLNVEKDFHGRIGGKTCGPAAAPGASLPPAGAELRKMVCEAADAQLFNVLLTPHYNWQHRNHFHFEVTAGVRWVLVR